ncbi:MAG: hypothetical protein ACUVRR_10825 [Candidatus Fervidibacter sp.]|uniref:hypothetical protein n=1 Tax=Candidatus Fervidibacter sp. TaxID=3100871 RepID=UPI004049EFA8
MRGKKKAAIEDKTPVAGGELQEALKELDGWMISITNGLLTQFQSGISEKWTHQLYL